MDLLVNDLLIIGQRAFSASGPSFVVMLLNLFAEVTIWIHLREAGLQTVFIIIYDIYSLFNKLVFCNRWHFLAGQVKFHSYKHRSKRFVNSLSHLIRTEITFLVSILFTFRVKWEECLQLWRCWTKIKWLFKLHLRISPSPGLRSYLFRYVSSCTVDLLLNTSLILWQRRWH